MPRPNDEEKRNCCRNCIYWLPKNENDFGDQIGICRHNPPVGGDEFSKATWPITEENDWCGAYRRGIETK
jgi:hypothetical protein